MAFSSIAFGLLMNGGIDVISVLGPQTVPDKWRIESLG
jgi:hypothetical protein